jgi:integrase
MTMKLVNTMNGPTPTSEDETVQVRFKYVRSYHDRHGKRRVEYRRNGRTIPIHAEPGSAEFQAAYETAKALFETPDGRKSPEPVSPTSLRWLCVEYFKSAEFGQLSLITQNMRRGVLESILLERFRPGSPQLFADCPLKSLTHDHVIVLRDRKKHAPTAANARIKALSVLFKWGRGKGGLIHNPAHGVDKLKVFGDGHHTWTEQEREQFKSHHQLGSKARLAYALLFHTGQRRSDVVLFGRQHVHNGRLSFTQTKNRRNNPVSVEIPMPAELQQVIDATTTGDLTFLTNEDERPFTAAQFSDWFRRRCDEAGLPHCSAHGLRKSAATFHADNGCTAHELMAILGWLSISEAERYTRNADRKRNAERGMQRTKSRTGSV